jgi:Polyketide cyclase / dehydrase and lipid transport
MTVLENSIRIDAPPGTVWSVLASLDALDRYDPGIKRSEIVTPTREGREMISMDTASGSGAVPVLLAHEASSASFPPETEAVSNIQSRTPT